MSIKTYTNVMNPSQTEPVLGKKMVQNDAGGFVFELDVWGKLDRFLILGTEGGTYYVSENKLTKLNAENVIKAINTDGIRVVNRIVEISDSGRAQKNDPAIFALALCLKMGNVETRKAAQQAVNKVCRIGTHLFHLAEFIKAIGGGWGRGTKAAFNSFYDGDVKELVYDLIKYQSRDGWSHYDILRKSHPTPSNESQNEAFKWVTGKSANLEIPDLAQIKGFELLKKATTAKEVVSLIREYRLPRECVPTEFLNSKEVWEALLMDGNGMPMTAMIRNLGKMSQVGLLTPLSDASKYVMEKLDNAENLKRARVHPLSVLFALKTYSQGHGFRGGNTWTVDQNIVAALDSAYYKAFGAVEPTNKRYMLGLDVSGSMSWTNIGNGLLTCAEGAAAMAMITRKVEPFCYVGGFATNFIPLDISRANTLRDVMNKTSGINFGGTDCAMPMIHAQKHKIPVDVFCVYTDNDTWAGKVHPFKALQDYRQSTGIPAKLVVVGMVSTGFTIADPSDAGMLDVVGFDANTPSAISEFAK